MNGANSLLLALATIYGAALLVGWVAWVSHGRLPTAACWSLGILPLLSVLVIPSDHIKLRALVAFVATDCAFKLIDWTCRRSIVWNAATWRTFLWSLVPFPTLLVVHDRHCKRLQQPDPVLPHVVRILLGTVIFVTAIWLIRSLEVVEVIRGNAILQHLVRIAIYLPAVESLAQVMFAIERLAGFDTRPIIDKAYLARTVADFWQRYNYRVHDLLLHNVFWPSGGRQHPVRGVLLVFFFSGLFHEGMFALATSRWTGYQLAFFSVQGPAALASGYLQRLTRRHPVVRPIIGHGTTIVFMLVTSVLFFDGVSRVFPGILRGGSPLP